MASFDKRPTGPRKRDWTMILTAMTVVIGLVAYLFPRDSGDDDPVPPPASSSASLPPPTVTPIAGDTPTPTDTPTSSAPALPVMAWIADMEPVDDDSEVDPEAVSMGGADYVHSLHYICSAYCDDGGKSSETYYLGRDYRVFEVMVGVNDRAEEEQEGVFEVILDGRHAREVRVSSGSPKRVSVGVRGVLRLRLVAFRPGTTKSAIEAGANAAGGQSNLLPDLAWGNPRVTR